MYVSARLIKLFRFAATQSFAFASTANWENQSQGFRSVRTADTLVLGDYP